MRLNSVEHSRTITGTGASRMTTTFYRWNGISEVTTNATTNPMTMNNNTDGVANYFYIHNGILAGRSRDVRASVSMRVYYVVMLRNGTQSVRCAIVGATAPTVTLRSVR